MSSPQPSPLLIDSHQHFWRYDAVQYPWIPKGSPLERDWLPADLSALQKPLGLSGSIAVQARQSIAESHWLLGLADADPIVRGVVGWVDLQSDAVEEQLAPLAVHPNFVGVRHVTQDEPDEAFHIRPSVVRGLARLRQFGLRYDLLVFPNQLAAAIELVRRLPEQPFVLDHIAKPYVKRGDISPWREQIRELALAPNVMCKVSGMVTEADHATWSPEQFRPYLDIVFEAFGEDRLMWGSDWPVCLLAGSYSRVHQLVADYARQHSPAGQLKLFGANCAKFYLGRG